MNDPLNADLPSDRFVVEWASAEDTKRAQPPYTPPDQIMEASLTQWTLTDEGFPSVTGIDEKWLNRDVVSVAIPAAFQQMKEVSPSLALDWRMRTRYVFQTCFAKGFQVTNFMKYPGSSAPVHFYILTKKRCKNEHKTRHFTAFKNGFTSPFYHKPWERSGSRLYFSRNSRRRRTIRLG